MINFLADVAFYGTYLALGAGMIVICWLASYFLSSIQQWLRLAEHIRHNERLGR